MILCMITSQSTRDADAILLRNQDFAQGSLHQESYIRPTRLITADEDIVIRRVGKISASLTQEVVQKLIEIFSR